MSYELKDEDYLELWMYFQERADKIKEAMFATVTWTIGFAAALLGFIFATLVDFDAAKSAVDLSSLVLTVGLAGLVVCLYSWFAISEAANHIRANWERADRCQGNIKDFRTLIGMDGGESRKPMKIWNQLRVIVALFAVAFVAVLLWKAWR